MGRIAAAMESNREAIRALLEQAGVVLAYHFGSAARGHERSDSDLDLAVLFGRHVPPSLRSETRLKLLTGLVGLTHINDIDLVVMNDAPPLLNFQIVSTGLPILGQRSERTRFQVQAIQRFIDTRPIRELLEARLGKRLRAGGSASRSEPW
jgi:predicted nucleotidyltransferase